MPLPSSLRSRLRGLSATTVQLVRFGLVGGAGTGTNLLLFYVLVDLGPVAPLLGTIVCFGVAVSQNYVLNELWTFATREVRGALSLTRYGRFVVASLLGLGINLAVLAALLAGFDFPLVVIPQAFGIAAGTLFNFLASRQIVFRRGR